MPINIRGPRGVRSVTEISDSPRQCMNFQEDATHCVLSQPLTDPGSSDAEERPLVNHKDCKPKRGSIKCIQCRFHKKGVGDFLFQADATSAKKSRDKTIVPDVIKRAKPPSADPFLAQKNKVRGVSLELRTNFGYLIQKRKDLYENSARQRKR